MPAGRGSSNVVADALSWNVSSLFLAPLNHSVAADVARAQSLDPDLHKIAQTTFLSLQPQEIPNSPIPLWVDKSRLTSHVYFRHRYAWPHSGPSTVCQTLAFVKPSA
ncbi:hypothetical protein T10_249 [Trichinella papuae]|uniref:Uncharacterized protein n=1 Tax=Trichinella papuae TaxID=268474 RepID=A0A0V1N8E2_9BILA|nr:hypothetical protein T10_249 [Trichinella papuae]